MPMMSNAISMAALAGVPTDTFRPKLSWDFGPGDPAAFAPYGFAAGATPAPDDQTARRWTVSSGHLGRFTSFQIRPVEGYIVQARVRLNSGAWRGRAYYSPDGYWNYYQDVPAPPVGKWTIVSWDLRTPTAGNSILAQASIQGYALELGQANCSIDVDWVAVGVYGTGSRLGCDLALQSAISDLLSRADTTVFGNTVISNTTNLIPNPNSELTAATAERCHN